MNIVQIVPRLPPAINGVGDYSLNLARQLRQDFKIETHFIVGDSSWEGLSEIEGFSISKVSDYSGKALLSLLSQLAIDKILLHYVGYGYAKRGCPLWLIEGLEKWHNNKSTRLITMFHEIYASSWKPWTSSFWLSLQQKQLVKRLSDLSDSQLTSLQEYSQIIASLSRDRQKKILISPIFSNIGEPPKIASLANRKPQLVIFGGRGRRIQVYQNSIKELNLACQLLQIKQIIDIGPNTGLNLKKFVNVSLQEMGELSIAEISHILSQSQAGFFNYNVKRLAKSTIFASYCSHGILPISPHNHHLIIDSIKAGEHYWVVDQKQESFEGIKTLQSIANNAYYWYQNHNLSTQTKIVASQLKIQ